MLDPAATAAQRPQRAQRLAHRPEIDGLRAIAVVSVMFYHAGFAAFRGGFVGVDVFFVLSGYLITGIIASERVAGAFTLVGFYERRVRRLLPALALVVAICFPLAWLWLFPSEINMFAQSVVAVALFYPNMFFLAQTDYFAPNVAQWPLIHTWSLGVEEQFYLLFPLVLLALMRGGRKVTLGGLVVISVASLGLAQGSAAAYPEFDFYALPTRAWELGVGAMLAVSPQRSFGAGPRLADGLCLLGLLAVCASMTLIDAATPMPGLWSLWPVGGAALIIAFADPSRSGGWLLASWPMVAIGRLSYSLYLWHQPLLAFARLRFDVAPGGMSTLGVLALAFALAYLSWRFVERPFRDRGRMSRATVFGVAVAATVGLVIAARTISIHHGYPSRFPTAAAFVNTWGADYPPRMGECFGWGLSSKFIAPENACVYGPSSAPRLALWGDSHSAMLADALGAALGRAGASMRQFSFSNCPPIAGVRLSLERYRLCPAFDDAILAYLAAHREIETVLLFARWPMYFDGDRWDNGEGGSQTGAGLVASAADDRGDDRVAALGAAFRRSLLSLRKLGKRIVLIEPAPEMGWPVPERIAERNFRGVGSIANPLSIAMADWLARTRHFREQLAPVRDDPGILFIDTDRVFCNSTVAGRCVAEANGEPLYIDENHLNSVGARMLAREVTAAMAKAGWTP